MESTTHFFARDQVPRAMIRQMRAFMKFLFALVVVAALGVGVAWVVAGRAAGPTIEIKQPGQFIGQGGTAEVMVQAPGGRFSSLDVTVEQGAKSYPVYTLDPRERTNVTANAADRM